MKYSRFKRKLELLNREYGHHLNDFEISANKINGKSFLIFKNNDGKIIECIILTG